MASGTIGQMAREQVEYTDKECDEQFGILAFTHHLIDACDDHLWFVFIGRIGAEEATGDSHQHGGRDALTQHIADAEEQLAVTNKEVEEIAANGLGWCQSAIDTDIVAQKGIGGVALTSGSCWQY